MTHRALFPNGMRRPHVPLVCRWSEPENPLPRRFIRAPGKVTGWQTNGHPFDFSVNIARLCADIVARSADFRHINLSQLLFAVTQARNGHSHGLQARVTPLRFRTGAISRRRRNVTYQVQRYVVGNTDILYLITFCLPRFLDLDFDEKLVTLFHELYHISPAFDGDLRRHAGRYAIHSHSQKNYDKHMASLVRTYLAAGIDHDLLDFLHYDFAQLHERHGGIVGIVVPRPKIVPVVETLQA